MKTCIQCSRFFEWSDADAALLKKMAPVIGGKVCSFPAPQRCPDCRQQVRWAFRNQNKLYKRKCDFTGEEMVSLYSPDKPHKVYQESVWWSDQWDPMDHGRDFDFSRPFFDQFKELLLAVPRRGMHQDGTNEGSEYITFGFGNRNCYLMFAGFVCEEVYYSTWTGMLKNSMDCLFCMGGGERLYECVDCKACYECYFCHDCANCQDSLLLEDCVNCKNCIACKNLKDKQYHIYNQLVSKAEFEDFKKKLLEGGLEAERQKFNQWKLKFPHRALRVQNSENCVGNYLEHARNCINCFDVLMGAEDCRHCQFSGWKGKDMMDCTMCGKEGELLYQMHATTTAQRCAFVNFCRGCSDVYYSDCMSECQNCFGCIGLRHKKYCILNKQYGKAEYEALVSKIIERMNKAGEWGEFFPPSVSPFGYNETLAQEYFPWSKEQASDQGFGWCSYEPPAIQAVRTIPASRLPDKIVDVPDDVLNWAITCEATGKPFKIISQELKFYREHGLPIPRLHPEERHRRRMALRSPRKLYDRACAKCSAPMVTTYAPDRPEIVYCEECYLKEIY